MDVLAEIEDLIKDNEVCFSKRPTWIRVSPFIYQEVLYYLTKKKLHPTKAKNVQLLHPAYLGVSIVVDKSLTTRMISVSK